MPSASPSSWDRRRIVRLATIALLAAMVFPAAAVGPEWFNALVPPSAQFHALVALLIGDDPARSEHRRMRA